VGLIKAITIEFGPKDFFFCCRGWCLLFLSE